MTINWLAVFNKVLDGFAIGNGFILACVLWHLATNRKSKKDRGQA